MTKDKSDLVFDENVRIYDNAGRYQVVRVSTSRKKLLEALDDLSRASGLICEILTEIDSQPRKMSKKKL